MKGNGVMTAKRTNKNRILSVVLATVMIVGVLPLSGNVTYAETTDERCEVEGCFGTYDNGFCTVCEGYQSAKLTTDQHDIDDDGNKDAVYEISNAGQLYWFAALVNGELTDGTGQNTAANAILMKDIVVNRGTFHEDGTYTEKDESGADVESDNYISWTPIGNKFDNRYVGIFDGKNKTISGLYFDKLSVDCGGLFGIVGVGVVENVGVVDSYFNGRTCGGVCGLAVDSSTNGTITNCYNSGDVKGDTAGGICGVNVGVSIMKCYFDRDIYAGNAVEYNASTTVDTDTVLGKSTAEFQSGEVAYLLQEAQQVNSENGNKSLKSGDKI